MSGIAIVPVEPTEEMQEAGWEAGLAPSEPMGPQFPEINAAIWQAMVAAAPSPWRPIETAPKDGTRVLLANSKTVGTGRYLTRSPAGFDEEGFVWDGANRPIPGIALLALMWMPLPPPPTA